MRGAGAARAAVAFTTSPDWLRDPEKLALVAAGDDAALAAASPPASRKREHAAEMGLIRCSTYVPVSAP